MERTLTFIISIFLIIAIVVGIYFVHKYSYIDNIEISVLTEENEYMTIEPYLYDVNMIKKNFMFSSTLFDKADKYNKEVTCSYKIIINNDDIICYDGNKDGYAKYSRRVDSIDDVKEKIKKKKIEAVGNAKYIVKIIKLKKDLADMLVGLY